jgi:hypothetical protein|eukprot:COSAG02_NODE_743_length_17764_cov_9.908916_12_plen_149_part_00
MTRLGALRLQGTEGVEVTGCKFERLDGQAVLLDGYNRDATFARNTFYLLGGSGVVLWGYETNGDGTDGNQPRRTTVTENFCHEIGIYQKQSSCYFHAVSAQSTVTHNLFFVSASRLHLTRCKLKTAILTVPCLRSVGTGMQNGPRAMV